MILPSSQVRENFLAEAEVILPSCIKYCPSTITDYSVSSYSLICLKCQHGASGFISKIAVHSPDIICFVSGAFIKPVHQVLNAGNISPYRAVRYLRSFINYIILTIGVIEKILIIPQI